METNEIHGVHQVLIKVVSIVVWIVAAPLVLLVVLGFGYLMALGGMFDSSGDAASRILELISSIWGAVIPLGESALRLIAPILVLLVVFAVIKIFSVKPDEHGRAISALSDLPSILALIIVSAICILPFTGYGVPDVLQNVALVVVGFYFGKRESKNA